MYKTFERFVFHFRPDIYFEAPQWVRTWFRESESGAIFIAASVSGRLTNGDQQVRRDLKIKTYYCSPWCLTAAAAHDSRIIINDMIADAQDDSDITLH